MKICKDCGQSFPLADFKPYRRADPDGPRKPRCTPCDNAYNASIKRARPDRQPASSKFCPGCKQTLPGSQFSLNRRGHLGLQARCKTCTHAAARKKLYDLEQDEYLRMRREQNGRCASCGDRAKLVVDHCHRKGHVRGLLCGPCNQAEGLLKTAERARLLAAYIDRTAEGREVR